VVYRLKITKLQTEEKKEIQNEIPEEEEKKLKRRK
jgi:hypothetical protein